MDYRRALAALLILTCVGASEDRLPIREARWIAPEARLEQLSTYPAPCFGDWPDNLLYGASAFRDPLLLGGQAARAGLSCASCHRGGQGNPAFVFPGVSGAPGTADITASLLSSHRGDGVFNPVRIPDLTHDKPKISRTVPGVLEAFIRGLIVEEFDGAEPPPRVLKGLAEAVRALDPKACEKTTMTAIDADILSFEIALAATEEALDEGDRETAIAMLRAARSILGLGAERYPASLSALLGEADAELAKAQQLVREGRDIEDVKAVLTALEAMEPSAKRLWRARGKSLYDRKRLAKALSETGQR